MVILMGHYFWPSIGSFLQTKIKMKKQWDHLLVFIRMSSSIFILRKLRVHSPLGALAERIPELEWNMECRVSFFEKKLIFPFAGSISGVPVFDNTSRLLEVMTCNRGLKNFLKKESSWILIRNSIHKKAEYHILNIIILRTVISFYITMYHLILVLLEIQIDYHQARKIIQWFIPEKYIVYYTCSCNLKSEVELLNNENSGNHNKRIH